MPDSSPEISIIIATKNASKTLQRCIDSIISQTYPYWELIIIDGASSDGTVDILKANDNKIAYWESKTDRGIAHAWNKAVIKTRGDWLIFLGADDQLHDPDVLSSIRSSLMKARQRGRKIAYGKVLLVDTNGDSIGIRGRPWPEAKKRLFIDNRHIHHQGVFHHAGLFKEHGLFDENFQMIAMDYEMVIRELKKADAYFIDHIITVAAAGGVSWSGKHALKSTLSLCRAMRKNGIKITSSPFIFYTLLKSAAAYGLAIILGEKLLLNMVTYFKKLKNS